MKTNEDQMNMDYEQYKFVSDFMLEYYKKFDKVTPKDLGVLFITVGSSLIAAGSSISKAK
jgi:hypothetical protein